MQHMPIHMDSENSPPGRGVFRPLGIGWKHTKRTRKKAHMDDQSPVNEPQPEFLDRREARRQRRAERLADPSRGGAWVAGLIMIILGGIFLLRNTGTFNIP